MQGSVKGLVDERPEWRRRERKRNKKNPEPAIDGKQRQRQNQELNRVQGKEPAGHRLIEPGGNGKTIPERIASRHRRILRLDRRATPVKVS